MANATSKEVFPASIAYLKKYISRKYDEEVTDPDSFIQIIEELINRQKVHPIVFDLVKIESAIQKCSQQAGQINKIITQPLVNPTLEVLSVNWQGLSKLLKQLTLPEPPIKEEAYYLVWVEQKTGKTRHEYASKQDLLALKIIVEKSHPNCVAKDNNVPVSWIDAALSNAQKKGIILSPPSKIRRKTQIFLRDNISEKFLSAQVFTLQWHITQKCELKCKHCYDRSNRAEFNINQAIEVLDQLSQFCRDKFVGGNVTLTGGNPLLYRDIISLYQAISDRYFSISILGNPTTEKKIHQLISIQKPSSYQVSLEGLEIHNDQIRGKGHFNSILDFLEILKKNNIYSQVMLTLTKNNMDQVIPLANLLTGKTDRFTFNRLSAFGEGTKLESVEKKSFVKFLYDYKEAAKTNPIMGFKDNLFNILYYQNDEDLFGGCTGFGCGAAFNFLTLLADGEVHACRKYPSLIGTLPENSLAEIYDSALANRYRHGSSACNHCQIRTVCGGCPAVTASSGLSATKDKDPYCFI